MRLAVAHIALRLTPSDSASLTIGSYPRHHCKMIKAVTSSLRWATFLLALIVVVAPAVAEDFGPYEGRDAVVEGTGGTRVQANGVDFWTYGTPPRAYRILGIITDKRPAQGFGSNPTKSRALAKRVKDAGGDAAIFVSEETRATGAFNLGNGLSTMVEDRSTRLLVVRYEESEASQSRPPEALP